ncbi:MAG: hypothetical protein ACE5IH_07690 [Thermodesulfobacteriota bacterium]
MKGRKKDVQDSTQGKRPYTSPKIMIEETFGFALDALGSRRSPVKCLRRPGQGGACRFIPRLS